MTDLTVEVNGRTLTATWTDGSPETRAALADTLPVEGTATRWGDEPRAAAPVNVVAELDDVGPLRSLSGGADVRVSPAE